MTDNILQFPIKGKEEVKSLTEVDVENFKELVSRSLEEFNSYGVMEKYNLYKTLVEFSFTCTDIILEKHKE